MKKTNIYLLTMKSHKKSEDYNLIIS